jgi:hypothetical protein
MVAINIGVVSPHLSHYVTVSVPRFPYALRELHRTVLNCFFESALDRFGGRRPARGASQSRP